MQRPCGGRGQDLTGGFEWRSVWQEWREQKHVGRTSQSLKELRPYPKSEVDTWGQTGGGQEGIQFQCGLWDSETYREEGFRTCS